MSPQPSFSKVQLSRTNKAMTTMGVDLHVLNFLAGTHGIHGRAFGRTLSLGRQGFNITSQAARRSAEEVLRLYDPNVSLDAVQPAGAIWADGLFNYLGATSLVAMDASSFEGAEIVHDLNFPVPSALYSAFDTIFDGGTLEHVFDVPTALRSVAAMLPVGGRFLS